MKHSHIDPKSDAEDETDQEGFISRWSRRKSAARRGDPDEAVLAAEAEQAIIDEEAERQRIIDERNKLTDADMPLLESLDENSDYSPFLSESVSEDLRRLALRQMFRLPKFGVLDGLNDYDEDYTVFEPLGDTITADMRFHAEREEAERKRKEAEQAALSDDDHVAELDDTPDDANEQENGDELVPSEDAEDPKRIAQEDELEDSEVLDG